MDWQEYIKTTVKCLNCEQALKQQLVKKTSVFFNPVQKSVKSLSKLNHVLKRQSELILKMILLKLNLALLPIDEIPFTQTNPFKTIKSDLRWQKFKYFIGFVFTLFLMFIFLIIWYNDFINK